MKTKKKKKRTDSVHSGLMTNPRRLYLRDVGARTRKKETTAQQQFLSKSEMFNLKVIKIFEKPRSRCLSKKITAAATVLCPSWCGPAVLTTVWPLGGALAPSNPP